MLTAQSGEILINLVMYRGLVGWYFKCVGLLICNVSLTDSGHMCDISALSWTAMHLLSFQYKVVFPLHFLYLWSRPQKGLSYIVPMYCTRTNQQHRLWLWSSKPQTVMSIASTTIVSAGSCNRHSYPTSIKVIHITEAIHIFRTGHL